MIDAEAKAKLDAWLAEMERAGRLRFRAGHDRLPAGGTYVAPAIVALDRAAVSVAGGLAMLVHRRRTSRAVTGLDDGDLEYSRADRLNWRMPPLSELGAPVISRARRLGLTALWAYLLIALVMVIVKVVLIALH